MFGVSSSNPHLESTQPIDKKHWGEVEILEEEEEEEEMEEEGEGEEAMEDQEMEENEEPHEEAAETFAPTPSVAQTPSTPLVTTSVVAHTPGDPLNILKSSGDKPYTELKMEQAKAGNGLLGTSFKYNIPGVIVPGTTTEDEDEDEEEGIGAESADKKKEKKEKKKKGFKF